MASQDYQQLDSAELGRKRHALVEEIGRIEDELNRRRKKDRHVMAAEELDWKDVREILGTGMKAGVARRATLVAPELGFNVHNFVAFLAEFPAGSEEGAYHMHGEAVKYYLSGQGIEIIGDKRYTVKAGDTVFIPAHTWHGSQNPGPDPLRYLAVASAGFGVPVCIQPVFKTREDLMEK
jgi:mannose-6-phosphate isomerase-like protein (cupin superfamily)